jgi:hypothetical protein
MQTCRLGAVGMLTRIDKQPYAVTEVNDDCLASARAEERELNLVS